MDKPDFYGALMGNFGKPVTQSAPLPKDFLPPKPAEASLATGDPLTANKVQGIFAQAGPAVNQPGGPGPMANKGSAPAMGMGGAWGTNG